MIKENLKTVQEHIKESIAKRHNAASEDVLLVAVTKNHDVASMQEAIDAAPALAKAEDNLSVLPLWA